MAKRKTIETSGGDTAATPDDSIDKTQAGPELPAVEVTVDFSCGGGNRCRPGGRGRTARGCRASREHIRRRSAGGIIRPDEFSTHSIPSTSQTLCPACRLRGDRSRVRCSSGRCGDRRILQGAGRQYCCDGREQGDATIRRASFQGSHKSEGEPRCRQQGGSQPDCETQRSPEPRDRGNHGPYHAAADGPAGAAGVRAPPPAPRPRSRRTTAARAPGNCARLVDPRDARRSGLYVQGHGDVIRWFRARHCRALGRSRRSDAQDRRRPR